MRNKGQNDLNGFFPTDKEISVNKRRKLHVAIVVALSSFTEVVLANEEENPVGDRYAQRSYLHFENPTSQKERDGTLENPGFIWLDGTCVNIGPNPYEFDNVAKYIGNAWNAACRAESSVSGDTISNCANTAFAGIELVFEDNSKVFDFVRNLPKKHVCLSVAGVHAPVAGDILTSDAQDKLENNANFSFVSLGSIRLLQNLAVIPAPPAPPPAPYVMPNGTSIFGDLLKTELPKIINERKLNENTDNQVGGGSNYYNDTEGRIVYELLNLPTSGQNLLGLNIDRMLAIASPQQKKRNKQKDQSANSISLIALHIFTKKDACKLCAKVLIALSKGMNNLGKNQGLQSHLFNAFSGLDRLESLTKRLVNRDTRFLVIVHSNEQDIEGFANRNSHADCLTGTENVKTKSLSFEKDLNHGQKIIFCRPSRSTSTCKLKDEKGERMHKKG
ncbi:MAG: hypothetical protein LBJ89_02545 [Holosporales bacterium]|jgi:hypothetical protein|nr:hypothetical protein [Holosporales bacterium]